MRALLEFENVDTAVIVRPTASGSVEKIARVYRLKDGWHTKRADLHTKQAWAGPYASAEQAFEELTHEQLQSA